MTTTAVDTAPHTTVTVAQVPVCDLDGTVAYADARIGHGWANVCKHHFDTMGCKLGVGHGQQYIVDPNLPK
jgi:hypothetical protein